MAFQTLLMTNTTTFSRDKIIWEHGYAFSGERTTIQHLLVRSQSISSIAAIYTDGLIALEVTVNGETFFVAC